MSGIQTHIGVKVFDKEVDIAPLIQGVNFTNIGILVKTKRGIPNKAVRVGSETELYKLYGEESNDTNGVAAVKYLFRNANPYGVNAYLVRVVEGADGDIAASNAVQTAGGTFVKPKPGNALTLDQASEGITISAGSSAGLVDVEIAADGGATTETYTDLPIEDFVEAINFGTGSYTASALITVEYFGGLADAVAQTAIPAAGVKLASGNTVTYTAGQLGEADPGAWANQYGFEIVVDTNNPESRTLNVYKKVDGEFVPVESVAGITYQNQVSILSGQSYYVKLTLGGAGEGLIDPTNGIIQFTGGVDSSVALAQADIVGTASDGKGAYALNTVDELSAITLTDYLSAVADNQGLAQALDAFTEAYRPRAICYFNIDASITELETAAWANLLRKKSYLATIVGWGTTTDGFGGNKNIPCFPALYGSGFVKKMLDGDGLPHVSPGGNGSAFSGFSAVTTQPLSDTDLLQLVKVLGCNPVVSTPGIGFTLKSTRLMSTNNIFYDIHKRRATNYISDSFQQSLGWIEQEAHTVETRAKLVSAQVQFLSDLYNRGMFDNSEGFDAAVQVKCDAENNPANQVARRILVSDSIVKIVDTIETASIILRSTDRFLNVDAN